MNLKSLFWDQQVSENILKKILSGEIENYKSLTKEKIYIRMLNSWSWYTILEKVTISRIEELLTEEIINKLYPKALQDRYLYAKKILFTKTLPPSG